MLRLNHYNDGKEKSQSHEIRIRECQFYCAEYDVFSHNPFDITGYGETKEEALEDFKRKFDYVMRELKAFEKMLFEYDIPLDEPNNFIKVGHADWAAIRDVSNGE